VVPDGLDRHDIAEILYPRLLGLGVVVDLLVVTPALMEKYKTFSSLIYYDIGRDGRELYTA